MAFNPLANFMQGQQFFDQQQASALERFEALDKKRQEAFFLDARKGRQLLEANDSAGFTNLLKNRFESIEKLGGDTSDVESIAQTFMGGDIDGALAQLKQVEDMGVFRGSLPDEELRQAALDKAKSGGLASAKTKVFDNGTIVTQLPDKTTQVTNPAGDVVTGEDRVAALKLARKEQIGFAGKKAEATAAGKVVGETSKANLVANAKVKINTAVKLAEIEAKDRGETLTELAKAQASMPGLISVVDQLKELAPIATSTLGGRVFDSVVKESGFGATKGSTARAKFVGIVSNQVLPLLKQTFGAAFTKAEGDELKATMGDPDASPAEKMAQLDAFIDGKVREIQTKERELGRVATPSTGILSPEKKTRLDELRSKAGF